MNNKNYIKKIVFASLVAALYTGLTYLGAVFGISYGGIQFRISEVLTVLPVFSEISIIGLTIGCFLGNIASFNPIDMIIGTFATFISAVLSYLLRKITLKGVPYLSFFAPVIINALLIGFEISYFFTESSSPFYIVALFVGIGEAVVCLGLGIPFYLLLNKHKSSLIDFF